ncbi:MAG: NAD(P)/FAD-dependent oxidoreductase [Thermoflexales bacterium]|nr:NAD(P)/FAD-dependent oxidoreductase [Thermoflexales bacterium]
MRVVVLGAGPAGVTVVETLRHLGSDAEIVMVTEEPYPPYSPAAMAAYFLTGRPFHFWRGEDFPQRMGVDYRPGARVVGVEPEAHRVRLADGETLPYDKLVIATGGRLYAPVEGSDKPGVYNFKSLSTAERLMARARRGEARSALIVGAGFIGIEIALLLADLGLEVTLLVRSRVMRAMLDPEVSGIVERLLEGRGIRLIRGADADAVAFVGEPEVRAVATRSGAEMTADLFIAATGLRPNVEFLADAGLACDFGLLVDERQRTSDPDIYACGDVAETVDRLTGERYVHAILPNAVYQGRVVAANLLGLNVTYEGADSMNSLKHLGLPVIVAGHTRGEEIRWEGRNVLRKIWLWDGRIGGFCLVGDIRAAGVYRTLMVRKVDVSPFRDRLPEPEFGEGVLVGLAQG